MEGYEEAGFDPAPIEMALEMSEWAIAGFVVPQNKRKSRYPAFPRMKTE